MEDPNQGTSSSGTGLHLPSPETSEPIEDPERTPSPQEQTLSISVCAGVS